MHLPRPPREPVPAVGQGIFNITNLLRPDIQDSIQIFPLPSSNAAAFCGPGEISPGSLFRFRQLLGSI